MKLKECLEKSAEKEEIKNILDKNGYLCSIFSFIKPSQNKIEKWELGYYLPNENKILPVEAKKNISIGKKDKPLKKKTHRIFQEKIKISPEKILEEAKKVEKEEYNKKIQKILIALIGEDEKQVWKVSFVTSSFSIISIKINSENGKVIDKKEKSLMRKNIGL